MKIKFLFIALAFSVAAAAAPPAEEGRTIFTIRCSVCHNINKVLTGPALAGVDKRRSIDWIINFVHSSQTVIKKGDKDAVALFEKFNRIPMPDHADLTPDNIKSIVAYIQSQAGNTTDQAPFATPTKLQKPYIPISITNYPFFISYLIAIALMIAGLLFAVRVKAIDRKLSGE
jgi:mono/diheme cytochrome c family protein